MRHDGIYLQTPGERHHIDFPALCGQSVWVYGQTELTKDLVAARLDAGQQIHWEVANTAIHDVTTNRPAVTFTGVCGAPACSRRVSARSIARMSWTCSPSSSSSIASWNRRAARGSRV